MGLFMFCIDWNNDGNIDITDDFLSFEILQQIEDSEENEETYEEGDN